MTNEPAWLVRARRQLGVAEIPGPKADPHILAYRKHAQCFEDSPLDDGELAWCAIFVNAMLELSGVRGTRAGMERGFLRYGTSLPLDRIPLGAIVVFSSARGAMSGHVGFAVGTTVSHIQVLGGNQDDAVSIAAFPRSRLIGAIWPRGTPIPDERLATSTAAVGREVSDG
jgi:uncharacterized protein (TIGR02594 family)